MLCGYWEDYSPHRLITILVKPVMVACGSHACRDVFSSSLQFPDLGEAFASKVWPFGRCGGVRPLFGLNPFGFLGILEREIFTFLSHSMFWVENKRYFSIY